MMMAMIWRRASRHNRQCESNGYNGTEVIMMMITIIVNDDDDDMETCE